MLRKHAESIVSQRGWLSRTSDDFRDRLLENARLLKYEPGQVIFTKGDPAGGIYGLVSGTLGIIAAPPYSIPRLIDIAVAGDWTGEDCFISGKPRRSGLIAQNETWVLHVSLESMEQMASRDANNMRAFGAMSILAADSMLRLVHDLQKKNASARIASALHRICWAARTPVTLSQESLGTITTTSRKQVNAIIKRFVDDGWIETGYRSITVINPGALKAHADEDLAE
ncbi:MAG: Crp/Fnr family transcriptional regulator [Enterobacter ludwigii]|nr:Crp/Fnr family transcriptional regulator [Enterobacter ludwigii]